MKKAMLHTKVSVKLHKSELRAEWYLYLEAYPVFKAGYDKPQREREYLNRIITTPMWDKSRPARLNANGEQSYKPKRDQNGIIVCRSKNDRETCIFADNVRNIRQHEYDNAELYSEADQAMAEQSDLKVGINDEGLAQLDERNNTAISAFKQALDKHEKRINDLFAHQQKELKRIRNIEEGAYFNGRTYA